MALVAANDPRKLVSFVFSPGTCWLPTVGGFFYFSEAQLQLDSYATQVMADLDICPDYSTRRLVLLAAFKRVAEMEREACVRIAEMPEVLGLPGYEGPPSVEGILRGKITDAIRQRT